MGIRLEFVLIILIVMTIVLTTMVELTDPKTTNIQHYKELEFHNTTFIDVDNKQMQAKLYTTYGLRKEGVLSLDKLRYHTKNIKLLLADKGTYKEDILYLDGNVSLQEKEGFLYITDHANYHQDTHMLHITSDFVAMMNKNIIKGKTLSYNTLQKEGNATRIDAVIYTSEK